MKITKKNLLCAPLLFYTISIFAIPNPASVNCLNKGYTHYSIQNVGICIFPDGTYCEEWAFFKRICKPGQNKFPGGKFSKAKMTQYCIRRVNNAPRVKICYPGRTFR